MIRHLALSLIPLFSIACASPSDEDTDEGTGAVEVAEAITIENWKTHPAITAIDSDVKKIDQARLKAEKLDNLCEGIGESQRTKHLDGTKIRKLVLEGCGEEHCSVDTLYYDDASGRVVYAHEMVNGMYAKTEHRVYFDNSGKRIWDVSRSKGADGIDDNGNPKEVNLETEPFAKSTEQTSLELVSDLKEAPSKLFDAPPSCGN